MALCKLSVTSRPQDWFRVDNRTLTLRPAQLPKLGVFSPRASNWSSGSRLEMPFPTPPPLLLLLSNYKKAACCNHHPDNNRRCTGTMRKSAARAKPKFAASLLPTLCFLIERLPGLVLYRSAMKLKLLQAPGFSMCTSASPFHRG